MTKNDTPSLSSQRAPLHSEVGRYAKTASEIEGEWFVALDQNAKLAKSNMPCKLH